MKKQLHILEGFIILIIIFIASLLTIKFIYHIKHEKLDTSYMWNIYFTNLNVSEKSTDGKITFDNSTLNLDVTLTKDDEFYEFTIDIVNDGSLDATIDDINISVNNPDNVLTYTCLYEDGRIINKGDILHSKETQTIKVHISYPKQKSKIYNSLNLNLSLSITYTALY